VKYFVKLNEMNKPKVEIFTAGCPVCNPVIDMVKSLACENCEITVYDLVKQCESKEIAAKVEQYNIKKLPAVTVNGELLNCCRDKEITKEDLINAGIGKKQ
jgi:hypothetical protein